MTNITVKVLVAAPADRVWQALVDPSEVACWDGASPQSIPDGYPLPGQHARWRVAVGPFRLTLHDRISAVQPGRQLASAIDIGPVHLEEEYRLVAVDGGTEVVSANEVSARLPGGGHWRGAGGLFRWWADAGVRGAMARLKAHCERD